MYIPQPITMHYSHYSVTVAFAHSHSCTHTHTLQLIIPIAERLDVPLDNIWANVILFNDDGSYKSFDDGQPTSQTGGKAKVVARYEHSNPDSKPET